MMQITANEAKEMSRAELEMRLSALLVEDELEDDGVIAEYETLASIEAVSAELQRKRAHGDDGSGSPMQNMYL